MKAKIIAGMLVIALAVISTGAAAQGNGEGACNGLINGDGDCPNDCDISTLSENGNCHGLGDGTGPLDEGPCDGDGPWWDDENP